jgi:cystathionine beta-lyase/cystathionine gamma-synthase
MPDPTSTPTSPDPTAEPPVWHAETRAIRAGRADNDTALAPVLWATTTFVTPTVAEGRRMATSTGAHRFYSRYGNPTVRGFEEAIADLEGAESARAFASGMGAIMLSSSASARPVTTSSPSASSTPRPPRSCSASVPVSASR